MSKVYKDCSNIPENNTDIYSNFISAIENAVEFACEYNNVSVNYMDLINKQKGRIEHLEKQLSNSKPICPRCNGRGYTRHADAAGDMESRTCNECNGTGVKNNA